MDCWCVVWGWQKEKKAREKLTTREEEEEEQARVNKVGQTEWHVLLV